MEGKERLKRIWKGRQEREGGNYRKERWEREGKMGKGRQERVGGKMYGQE